jgi:histidinol-phosphate aminotransferase
MVWKMEAGFTLKMPLTADRLAANAKQLGALDLLNLNEACQAPQQTVSEQVNRSLDGLNRYPDIKREELSQAVAQQTGVSPQCQVWGAGASDLLYRAFNATAIAGKNAVAPTPTFWGYERIYRLTQVEIRRVEIRKDCRTHVQDILDAMDENTSLVSLVTPANPTGLSLSHDDIITLATQVPDDVLLLIDEVYFEFAQNKLNAVELLRQHRKGHWGVLRSFSKAYALASARIGYALCSTEGVAHRLIESGLNFPVSGLSFSAAYAVFTDRDFLKNIVDTTCQQRDFIRSELESLGLSPLHCDTNFVSVELPIAATESLALLKNSGIVCGQWNHPNFANYIRITVGTELENKRLIEAIKQLLLPLRASNLVVS